MKTDITKRPTKCFTWKIKESIELFDKLDNTGSGEISFHYEKNNLFLSFYNSDLIATNTIPFWENTYEENFGKEYVIDYNEFKTFVKDIEEIDNIKKSFREKYVTFGDKKINSIERKFIPKEVNGFEFGIDKNVIWKICALTVGKTKED
ncbi:MAG: hypothetical protein ACRC4M_05945 [Mycoplasma sp.]